MATDPETVAYILEQMAGAGGLRAAKMFSEYAIYCDEKVVALVCDGQLFLKPTPGALAMLGAVPQGPAYPGGKPMLIADALLDDPDLLARAVRQIAGDLPAPKPKKPKPGKRKKAEP